MKLAVSNIAWAPADRIAAYALLAEAGYAGLEIAPGLFFHAASDPFEPSEAVAAEAVAEMAGAGLRLVSMQSLLFGVQGAALFGDADAQTRFETGMDRAIALADRFGIPNLVFGSPGVRSVPEGMAPDAATEHAATLFRRLGDRARDAGTVIAMEPNAAAYGTNFLNRLTDVAAFVAQVDHPAVTVILDVGAMHMNDEFADTPRQIPAILDRLTHVHVSEPQLAPAPASTDEARTVLTALADGGYDRFVSIEMKAPEGGLATVRAAVTRLAEANRELTPS